jgi:hypothetical protein
MTWRSNISRSAEAAAKELTRVARVSPPILLVETEVGRGGFAWAVNFYCNRDRLNSRLTTRIGLRRPPSFYPPNQELKIPDAANGKPAKILS